MTDLPILFWFTNLTALLVYNYSLGQNYIFLLYLHYLHLQCSNRMLLLDEYASQDKEEFTIELLNLSQVLKDSQSSVIYRVDDKAFGKNKVSPWLPCESLTPLLTTNTLSPPMLCALKTNDCRCSLVPISSHLHMGVHLEIPSFLT